MEHKGKTSWGAEWTYDTGKQFLVIQLEEVGYCVHFSHVNDVFSDVLPLSLEQRREVCLLLETGRKFSTLVNDLEDSLFQFQNKVKSFGYQQRYLPPQEGDLQEKANELFKKINRFRDELRSSM